MLDHDHFIKHHSDAFFDQASRAAKETAALRRADGLRADDLAKGYIDQQSAVSTAELLEMKRVNRQSLFRPVAEQFRRDAGAYVDRAFAIKPTVAADLAPILPLLGNDVSAYKSLARQYANDYTALSLIAKEAERNDLYFGTQLAHDLECYRSECERCLPGLADTASNGVLGKSAMWDDVYRSKLETVKMAREVVDRTIGVSEQPMHKASQMIADALENARWAS